MPIFHDPHESPPWRTVSRQMSSDEAQRGFSHDVSPLGSFQPDEISGTSMASELVGHERKPQPHDRNELIERIKRVKSPIWQLRQDVSNPPFLPNHYHGRRGAQLVYSELIKHPGWCAQLQSTGLTTIFSRQAKDTHLVCCKSSTTHNDS